MRLRKVRPAIHELVSIDSALYGPPDHDGGWVQLLELAQILNFKSEYEKRVLDLYWRISGEALGNKRGLVGVTVRHQYFTTGGSPVEEQTVFSGDSVNERQWWDAGTIYVPAGFSQRVLEAAKHGAHRFTCINGPHVNCATNTIVCWKHHPLEDFDVVVTGADCLRYTGRVYRVSRNAAALLRAAPEVSLRKPGTDARTARQNAAETLDNLQEPIAALDFRTRINNCMRDERIETVRELVLKTPEDLLGIKNFGTICLSEINARLAERGLHLGMTEEEIAAIQQMARQ